MDERQDARFVAAVQRSLWGGGKDEDGEIADVETSLAAFGLKET